LALPHLFNMQPAGMEAGCMYRSGCMRRFGGPDKRLRSKRRADKLWVEARKLLRSNIKVRKS
jgi:hypothetical protein